MASVDLSFEGPVARLFLARPERRNAFDDTLAAELLEAVVVLSAREDVRVVVLGGHGGVFCAGADLEWMRAAGRGPEENLAEARRLGALFSALDRLPKPVVARVHGAALGGGAGLVAAADIALAASGTVFGFSEVRLGLVPAVISPYVIGKIGVSAARELFLTGERFTAEKALEIGLVHAVAHRGEQELDLVVEGRVRELLQAAPSAIAAAKSLIRDVAGRAPDDVRDLTASRIAERRASAEGQEGIAAFLERRKPSWTT